MPVGSTVRVPEVYSHLKAEFSESQPKGRRLDVSIRQICGDPNLFEVDNLFSQEEARQTPFFPF